MKLSDIAKATGGQLHGDDVEINSASADSRLVENGGLFVALIGSRVNGHDFLKQAKAQGASAALISQVDSVDQLPCVVVEDTQKALESLAEYQRANMLFPVCAITGSCGKTTCRQLTSYVLSQVAPVLATQKSYNTDVGVPLTLAHLEDKHQFAVLELGANHPGEIAKLTHMVKPDVAVITNAYPVHIEGFGDLDGVACAKGEIFQGLPAEGIAIINADDAYAKFWQARIKGGRDIISFGLQSSADVFATDIVMNSQAAVEFDLHIKENVARVKLQLLGEHNVMNALVAAAIGHALDVPFDKIVKGLELAPSEESRLISHKGYAGAQIIDDSYNANPSAVKSVINLLAQLKEETFLVLGDMGELGEQAAHFHEEVGRYARDKGVYQLYCYGELSQHAAEAFGERGYYFTDKKELLMALKPKLNDNTTVLVKGSNAMKMHDIVQALV